MPKPILQALVLADHIYQDKATGKIIIAGTFNRLFCFKKRASAGHAAQPDENVEEESGGLRKLNWPDILAAGSPYAYVNLTAIRGTVPLELRYVDLSDNVVLLRVEFSATAGSPLDTVEAMIQLPRLPIPRVGVYALELLSDNEPLGSLRVTAVEFPAQNQ